MEIGLSEVVKFCTRKLIKRTHFMSPLEMINLFQDMMPNFSSKKCGSWGFKTCNFYDWQETVKTQKSLIFEAPNKYCMSGKHSVNLSVSAGGLNLLPSFQKTKKWGRLNMVQFLDGGCWGRGLGDFSGKGGWGSINIKIN